MRKFLAMLVLVAATPALADDFGDDAPKTHAKCKKPPCHCNDATSNPECVDAKACKTFCADHGGAVAMHKKHRRGGNAPTAANADE